MDPKERDNEEELLREAAAGGREATEQLLEKYRYLVRRQANALFLTGGDSDDLNQEGMIGLYQAIQNYDPSKNASFAAFAWMCIRRKMLSAVSESRSLKNHPLNTSVSLDSPENDSFSREDSYAAADSASDPEEMMIRSEEERRMADQMEGLLSSYEKKVFRQYLDGLKIAEIAERQGKSIKSVENALQRIRQKIRQTRREAEKSGMEQKTESSSKKTRNQD